MHSHQGPEDRLAFQLLSSIGLSGKMKRSDCGLESRVPGIPVVIWCRMNLTITPFRPQAKKPRYGAVSIPSRLRIKDIKNPGSPFAERPGISCSTDGCGSLMIVILGNAAH